MTVRNTAPSATSPTWPWLSRKRDAVGRADRGEDARVVDEMDEPADRHGDEPHRGDRAEPGRDRRGAAALHGEQPDQDREAEREDVGLEGRASTSFRPSTADSTEIAGVMIASP